jgi:hypothetical protein
MRVGAASRPWRECNRRRSPRAGSEVQRSLLTPAVGDASGPNATRGTQGAFDEQAWQREMNALRRISLLLSVAFAALCARIVIDGPNRLDCLTGALILFLLLCAMALRRQGRRLQAAPRPETERVDGR